MLIALVVFLISLVYEYVSTKAEYYVIQRLALHAATLSALLEGFSWVYVAAFISNKWLVIPSVIGAYCGTLIAVKQAHKQDGAKVRASI